MKDCIAAHACLLVVPVDHHGLVGGVHVVIVEILGDVHGGSTELALKLRIHTDESIVIRKLHMEEMARLLDVLNARLPEEIDDVHLLDADIAETVQLATVPEDAVYARTSLELVVPYIAVGLLKFALVKDYRDDGGQHLSLALIPLLTGQNVRGREVVHRVGMLVGNGVEQPSRGRLHILLLLLPHTLPVTELVPLLILNDPRFKVGFTLLVLLQSLIGSLYLLLADDLCQSSEAIDSTALCSYATTLCHHTVEFILRGRSGS